MRYFSVAEAARRWDLSERSVRNYCAKGRIPGALLTGKTWIIPECAEKPARKRRSDARNQPLSVILRQEKAAEHHEGIYEKIQIALTYYSNHIEGNSLTYEQTRMIYKSNSIGSNAVVRVDDLVETANHFCCVALIADTADQVLSERLIKQLHAILKNGTTDSRKEWFTVGDYKRLPNEVGIPHRCAEGRSRCDERTSEGLPHEEGKVSRGPAGVPLPLRTHPSISGR